MKISRSYLRRLIKEQVDLLFEQEEDPFATDDAAEEEGDDNDENLRYLPLNGKIAIFWYLDYICRYN